ncbi:MAG TPA: TlpA disulfide reductase family protein [Chitinophagaceae bacterium]|nr:TlpA disulfide reductase family protein [Chitinophagaceae bacterium]
MRYIMAGLLACLLYSAGAQTKKELVIGKPFPYQETIVLNSLPEKPLSINDMVNGKPLVVELFSSFCSSCFEGLPKINELRKQFHERIQFLLIGYEDGRISAVYQKFQDKLKLELEVAYDSLLFRHISYAAFPTYIWIGPDGNIKAVTTGSEQINETNLEKFARGEDLRFLQAPERQSFNGNKPYLLAGNGGMDSSYLVRRILGKWTPALPISIPQQLAYSRKGNYCNVLGASLENLYQLAYWGKLLRKTGDSLYGKVWPRLIGVTGDDTLQRYCYTVAYQDMAVPSLSQVLRNDLQSYFGYDVRIENRLMPCWIVSVDRTNSEPLKSKVSAYRGRFDFSGFDYQFIRMDYLIHLLAYVDRNPDIPFIDETGIDYPIDLKADALLTDREELFKALEREGIRIRLSQRPMKVLVLEKSKSVAAK